jgi:hypothetical protein
MRRRISRAFIATAAAGATVATLGFAAATAAGAATIGHRTSAGHRSFAPSAPAIPTPPCRNAVGYVPPPAAPTLAGGGCAGYVATGRDFRYAQAIIRIPTVNVNQGGAGGGPNDTAPIMVISLTSSNALATAGIMSCDTAAGLFAVSCTSGTWVAVGIVANNLAGTLVSHAVPLTGVNPGDGVKFAIYYNQAGNAIHMSVTTGPTTATPVTLAAFSFDAAGAVFNHASALVDWSDCPIGVDDNAPCAAAPGGGPIPGPVPGGKQIRITQFQLGAFTTASGQQGTFTGPWTLNSVLATSNGVLPPGGTVQVTPEFLWTDGLPGSGPNDAFGVWWR